MKDYFAYIRVSTARQGQTGVSLQEQREAIQLYADRHQLHISEWFEERETAAKRGRAKFTLMLSRLRKRQVAGVLMHKIDRSARNLRDWADLGDLIDTGVEVRFVTESLDLSSRGGRLTADIQAVVAADYIRNLREEARKGFYGRLKQGLYPLPAPLGYLDRGTGRPKAIDPERGPLVSLAFDLYATGEYSLDRLRAELARRGLTSHSGKPVSKGALSRLLNNPFYTGVIRIQTTGETFKGAHEPLVCPAQFQRVRAVLSGKINTKVRRHFFIYKQLLTCARCGRTLTGERQKGVVYYRCHGTACRGCSVREDAIDTQLGQVFEQIRLTPKEASILVEELDRAVGATAHDIERQRAAIELQTKSIDHRLDRLTDLLVDEAISREAHDRRREALLLEHAQLRQRSAELADAEVVKRVKADKLFELAQTAQLSHDLANPREKRELVKELSSNIFVDGKYASVELYSAYEQLKNRERVPCGGAYRDVFRTLAWALSTECERSDRILQN